jgi:CRP-like cAMP-binding protein
MAEPSPPSNRFLYALPGAIYKRLAVHCEEVALKRGMIIHPANIMADYLYFPDRGLISLVKIMSDGRSAEVGFIGTSGIAGAPALLGMEEAGFESIVQLRGSARRLKSAVLRAEMEQSLVVRQLVLRWLHCYISQLAQTAACNRLHSLRQRCCRWLLIAYDNAERPEFELTHEFLALMMGVNRPTLTTTVGRLQEKGVIAYKRASIKILDREGLERDGCECYAALKTEADGVYDG